MEEGCADAETDVAVVVVFVLIFVLLFVNRWPVPENAKEVGDVN